MTGASSGLGEEIAKQLAAKHQANLILVARRKERLEDLKEDLSSQFDVEIKTVAADLSAADQVEQVAQACMSTDGFYGAILNAGVTYLGKYTEQSFANQQTIIQLNVQSTLQFTDLFVKHFESTGQSGRLMAVSSLAAYVPAPYQAVYSGSKAFLTTFYHALKQELTNEKFKLSTFSPGGIKTEMTSADGFNDLGKYLMPVHQAAASAVKGFIKGDQDVVPGLENKLSMAALSLVPTRIISKVMGGKYLKSIENSKLSK